MTLPYPLYNFFATFSSINYCHQLIIFNHHHITYHSSYTPFHVTDDPIEFQLFQFFPSTVVVLDPFRLLHPMHVSVHIYFLTFNRQFPLFSITRPGFKNSILPT